jgi:hypothetical protein
MKNSAAALAAACFVLGGALLSPLASPAHAGAAPGETAGAKGTHSPLACDRSALTAEERKRHFEELGPKLRALKTDVRELPDGYEFAFPSDAETYRLLAEWAAGERACCPFFDVDVRSTREKGPVFLSLTGREGVKGFIQDEGAAWLKK